MGGDEFIVVLLNMPEDEIAYLCQAVQKRLVERSKELPFEYTISTSYGFAIKRRGSEESLDDIVTKADEKMYCYKENHR